MRCVKKVWAERRRIVMRELKPIVFIEKAKKRFFQRKKRRLYVPPLEIFLVAAAHFAARTALFSNLHPFGGAFFAAVFSGKASFIYALSVISGMFFSGADFSSIGSYIFAMCVFSLVVEKFNAQNRDKPYVRAAVFSLSLALSGVFFMVSSARGASVVLFYDCVMLFIESAISFCAVMAFSTALPIVRNMRLHFSFSSAEEISLVLLFGSALCGAKDVSQIGPLNIADILCILVVLVFSVRLGAARGAVAGLTMGLISSLGSGSIGVGCVSYALSGLAAGLCSLYGAVPGCSAFILSNALVTVLANGSTEILINIYDIFAACLIYGAIPEKALSRITGFGARDETLRAASDEKLCAKYILSASGYTLSRIEKRLAYLDRSRSAASEEQAKFFERTARRACASCGMRRLCWKREAARTCESLRRALENYGDTGSFSEEFLPRNCLRPREFTEAFLRTAELYRTDLIWAGKLNELRAASRSQFSAFGDILSALLASFSDETRIDRALSDDIAVKMKEAGIEASDIVALRDKDSDPSVTLTLKSCGGFALCENGACEIVSRACGKKMVRAGRRDCKSCAVRYVVSPPHTMSFAHVSRAAKKKSGDTALFRVINKSLCAAVLCDGMGGGERAAGESLSAAETLLDLIELGVKGERALEIVNAMFLPFGEVTFSSADLCLYDALSGSATVIKCGGAATFSKSGERVDALYSKTLPLGAKFGKDVETYTFSAKGGDMIVMITDGVLDSALKDGWIISEMEKFRGKDPHDLCDLIVEKALLNHSDNPRDDMTVLAAYIN